MPLSVSVVLPWRAGCPWRTRALTWVLDRWHTRHPDWPTIVAPAPDGPWCKAVAVAAGLREADTDLVVVADTDVWCDLLPAAVQAVTDGRAWAVPHGEVRRLTPTATDSVLAGNEPDLGLELDEPAYRGVAGGGLVVAHRDLLLDVPLDPRFQGWGGEDHAWGHALKAITGRAWRPENRTAPCWHLWHPAQPRQDRRVGNPASELLRRRYVLAQQSPGRTRLLLDEAHAELATIGGR